jgi:hypothetical protein
MPLPRLYTDGVFPYWPARTVTGETIPEETDDIVVSASLATTAAEIAALLSDHVEVDFGVDLLTADELTVTDITDSVQSWTVHRGCFNTVHGTIDLAMDRAIDWPNEKVRPWIKVTSSTLYAIWYEGVYHLATPALPLGETPPVYSCQGVDKLAILNRPIGDSYSVAAGTVYLTAVTSLITAAGLTGASGTCLLDTSSIAATLTTAMVWILDDTQTTYLGAINDLLKAIGYRGLYCDQNGAFRSEAYIAPASRTPTWDFDMASLTTSVASEDRTYTVDEYDRTNWFRFLIAGKAPVETAPGTTSDTQYTVDNSASGTKYKHVEYLDVEDGAVLKSEGDRIVNELTQRKQMLELGASPLPVIWHFDSVLVRDPATGTDVMKCQVVDWSLPSDGSDMSLTLEVVA